MADKFMLKSSPLACIMEGGYLGPHLWTPGLAYPLVAHFIGFRKRTKYNILLIRQKGQVDVSSR